MDIEHENHPWWVYFRARHFATLYKFPTPNIAPTCAAREKKTTHIGWGFVFEHENLPDVGGFMFGAHPRPSLTRNVRWRVFRLTNSLPLPFRVTDGTDSLCLLPMQVSLSI